MATERGLSSWWGSIWKSEESGGASASRTEMSISQSPTGAGRSVDASGFSESASSKWRPKISITRKMIRDDLKFKLILSGKTLDSHKDFITRLKLVHLKEVNTEDECDFILVFCPIVSRAGTDIEAAMKHLHDISDTKPVVLVVLHHTFDTECVVPDSSKCVNRKNMIAVDCLFHEDTGLLQCLKNNDSLDKTSQYLKEYINCENMKKQKEGERSGLEGTNMKADQTTNVSEESENSQPERNKQLNPEPNIAIVEDMEKIMKQHLKRLKECLIENAQTLQEKDKTLEENETQLKQTKAELDKTIKLLEDSQRHMEEKNTQLENLNKLLMEKETQLKNSSIKLETSTIKVDTLGQELQKKDKTLEEKEKQLKQTRAELDKTIKALEDSQRHVEEKNTQLENLNKLLKEKETQLKDTDKELETSTNKLDTLGQELQDKQRQLQDKDRQLVSVKEELETSTNKLIERDEQLQEKNRLLTENTQTLQKKDKTLEEKEKQLSDVREELRKSNKTLEKNQTQLEEKDRLLTERETQLMERDKELQEKDRLLAETRQKLEMKDETLEHKGTHFFQEKEQEEQHSNQGIEELLETKSHLELKTNSLVKDQQEEEIKRQQEIEITDFKINEHLTQEKGSISITTNSELEKNRSPYEGHQQPVLEDTQIQGSQPEGEEREIKNVENKKETIEKNEHQMVRGIDLKGKETVQDKQSYSKNLQNADGMLMENKKQLNHVTENQQPGVEESNPNEPETQEEESDKQHEEKDRPQFCKRKLGKTTTEVQETPVEKKESERQ